MELQFQRFGQNLSTRPLGKQVRDEIVDGLRRNEQIVFDLAGVDSVTNSFADECFAKLLFELDITTLKRMTTFKNAKPFVQGVIAYAFKERMASIQTEQLSTTA